MVQRRVVFSFCSKLLNYSHGLPMRNYEARMCFSAEVAAIQKNHASFRTLENCPVNHTMAQEAKFYSMSKEDRTKLFPFFGIPKPYTEQIETFREACFMIRQPAVELIGYLEKTDFTAPAVRYVFYGEKGVGKSLSLCHIVHYAFVKQWFILHTPLVPCWTAYPREYTPSLYNPQRYDTSLDAAMWLQQFRSQNSHLLEQYDVRVSKKYEWSKREVVEEGEPLLSVIEHGVNRMKHASDCMAVIIKEIKEQSQLKGFKVLVAVDGANGFFHATRIRRPDKTCVEHNDITIVRAFKKLLSNDWMNAIVVTTVGTSAAPGDHREAFTPRYLLGKEGFEFLEPFIPILVKKYNPKEIDSCLDYYIDNLWIQSEDGRTEGGRKELIFLSGHNPAALMKVCSML